MMLLTLLAPLLTEGIPLPYIPRTDTLLTLVLLGCFLLSAYVLSRSSKFLVQLGKDFILHRKRNSIFTTSTAADMRYLMLLILQTSLLTAVCIFNYSIREHPSLVEYIEPALLLGIYVASCLTYLFLKWMVYSVLGWIFFDKSQSSLWLESYSTLIYYLGLPLFFFALYLVYFDFSSLSAIVFGTILFFFAKILILFKWLKFFCNNLHGSLLLILYFCALEVIPCLLLYQGLLGVNDFLITKI